MCSSLLEKESCPCYRSPSITPNSQGKYDSTLEQPIRLPVVPPTLIGVCRLIQIYYVLRVTFSAIHLQQTRSLYAMIRSASLTKRATRAFTSSFRSLWPPFLIGYPTHLNRWWSMVRMSLMSRFKIYSETIWQRKWRFNFFLKYEIFTLFNN